MVKQEISEEVTPVPAARRPQLVLLGGLVAVTAILIWLLMIYNRFITIHEGWFSYYGYLMKSGKVPYRDFYFFTQPVHLLITRIIIGFGDRLIFFRYYGLVERLVITAVLYFLYSRQFSAAAAVCGTIASSLFFLAFATDALFSYLYTCLLFVLLALACLYQSWVSPHRRSLWLVLTGVCVSLSFFTKQSNGLLETVAIGCIIVFLSDSIRAAVSDLVKYGAGVIIAAVPFLAWLIAEGAWQAYLHQVFLGAASSKGGLRAVFFGFIRRQVHFYPVLCFSLLVGALIFLAVTRRLSVLPAGTRARQLSQLTAIAVIGGAALLAFVSVHRVGERYVFLLRFSATTTINIILYSLVPLGAFVLWKRLSTPGREWMRGNEMPIALLIASCFWTWSCGMSWNIEESSVIPSAGLLLAFAYDRIQINRGNTASVLVMAATTFLIFLGVWEKYSCAFNWEGWRSAISIDNASSRYEHLAGFKLDRYDIEMYDTIYDEIAANTKPGEPIVTFPTIPVFNYVGPHPQPAFAPVHYWDVCPDDVAFSDAARIKASPPKMIVDLDLAWWVWKEHDEGWRAGHKSGQHELHDVLMGLVNSGAYRLVSTHRTPLYDLPVNVWLREP